TAISTTKAGSPVKTSPAAISASRTRPNHAMGSAFGARAEDVDDRLQEEQAREEPQRELDEEIARVVGLRKALELPHRHPHDLQARVEDEERPRREAEKSTQPRDPSARTRCIALRERVGREMDALTGRRGDRGGDEQRKDPLSEIVRLARISLHHVTQRPL